MLDSRPQKRPAARVSVQQQKKPKGGKNLKRPAKRDPPEADFEDDDEEEELPSDAEDATGELRQRWTRLP